MLTFLRRLFCWHNYHSYTITATSLRDCLSYKVCQKCGKIINASGTVTYTLAK